MLVSESDDQQLKNIKQVYREFSFWFLKSKSIRIILENKKEYSEDLIDYIQYKNNRYLNFILFSDINFTNKKYKDPLIEKL